MVTTAPKFSLQHILLTTGFWCYHYRFVAIWEGQGWAMFWYSLDVPKNQNIDIFLQKVYWVVVYESERGIWKGNTLSTHAYTHIHLGSGKYKAVGVYLAIQVWQRLACDRCE